MRHSANFPTKTLCKSIQVHVWDSQFRKSDKHYVFRSRNSRMVSYLPTKVGQKTGADFVESTPGFGVEILHTFLCHRCSKSDILDMSSNSVPQNLGVK